MDVAAVLERAKDDGFKGFGGLCGEAAIAINRVLFADKGVLVGAFNAAFLDHERFVGHVAVRFEDVLWDADGRPKSEEDIESWGMLDPEDTDYREAAQELGFDWNDEVAEKVDFIEFDTHEEVTEQFGDANLAGMVAALERAVASVLAADGVDASSSMGPR